MKVGDTKQLTFATVPADADDASTALANTTWASSDESIATVDSTGKVTLIAEGTAKITATYGSFTAVTTVTGTKAS